MHQGTINGTINFKEHEGKHLEHVETLIRHLEAKQQKEDGKVPSSPPYPVTPPNAPVHDFWREMSPQLSYIDGSSASSMDHSLHGRSISWNLTDLDGTLNNAPHSLDPLDIYNGSHNKSANVPLPTLIPLARHASDSLCSNIKVNKEPNLLIMPEHSHFSSNILPKPLALSNSSDPSNNKNSNLVSMEAESKTSPQLTVVSVQKKDVKSKIQKRLSFGDTLDLQTTIYTPAEDAERNYCDRKFNGSSNKINEEEFYSSSGPPLIRRKSFDTQSQISYYMDKDLRYYFQHPWLRLIVAYLVIFCNFLLFAEDPVSHSHVGK